MKIDRSNFEANLSFLQKINMPSTDDNILEIGSGTGHLLKYLIEIGYNIKGTEANDSYIQYAKKNFNVDLFKETTAKLDFEDDSFDLVISFDVLEHIPEVDEHVAEVYRVLKEGGVYALCTPNKWTNTPFEIIKNKSLTKHKKYHCSLQNYWQLRKLFEIKGFDVEFIKVPVKNEFFIKKVKEHLGAAGAILIKAIPLDNLPYFFRTNFYLIGHKR